VCNLSCTDRISTADAVTWYCPGKITNAWSKFCITKYPCQARFQETTVTHIPRRSVALWGTQFITDYEIEACWSCKFLLLNLATLTYYHTGIRFRQRHCNSAFIIRRWDGDSANFDNLSPWLQIGVPVLLLISFVLSSATTMWNVIMYLCMLKRNTGDTIDQHYKSCWLMIMHLKVISSCPLRSSKNVKNKSDTKFQSKYESVVSYESEKELSMREVNVPQLPPLYGIHPYILLHHSAVKSGIYIEDFEPCLWWVMEIEKKGLDNVRGSPLTECM